MNNSKKTMLAFSGGLDTSFCLLHLKELGYEVGTLTVDTGGFSSEELTAIETRAYELGSSKHWTLDARAELFRDFIAYIIKGNVLRGGVYPLCVGAERVIQARELTKIAKSWEASSVAHGCTGAGNDQVRFDIQIGASAPGMEIIAPIRDLALSREHEIAYIEERGFKVEKSHKKYSINMGLLGTTIGGGQIHDAWEAVPNDAYTEPKSERAAEDIVLKFDGGIPVALNDQKIEAHLLLSQLNQIGGAHRIGRGVHIGDTILGIKGRIAFEAPGLLMVINAHRELEKITLTKWQQMIKSQAAEQYGMFLHEGQWSNPVMRDLEALLNSSQKFVTGEAKLRLAGGHFEVLGVRSEYSLINARAAYGEGSKLWSPADARGFCKISGIQNSLSEARNVKL